MSKKIKYKAPYIVHTWFERDRQNIWVEDANGKEVAIWWDENVIDMFESGYFDQRNLAESVMIYLIEQGIIYARKTRYDKGYGYILPDFSVE